MEVDVDWESKYHKASRFLTKLSFPLELFVSGAGIVCGIVLGGFYG